MKKAINMMIDEKTIEQIGSIKEMTRLPKNAIIEYAVMHYYKYWRKKIEDPEFEYSKSDPSLVDNFGF